MEIELRTPLFIHSSPSPPPPTFFFQITGCQFFPYCYQFFPYCYSKGRLPKIRDNDNEIYLVNLSTYSGI